MGWKLHVASNTHWDREWRHSFQRMRMDLVEMMDRLLDICETEPSFKHYHLDSQTILLEDYLEIRPEKRPLLEKHLKNGKLLAGPWYTLPDMFLISGEAIVRNMMRGHRIVESLGAKPMKAAYSPMSYGQTSQIAQIYKGFDMDGIMFYRGIDAYGIKNSEYILEGADGSRILGLKFSITMTRFNFRFNVFSGTINKSIHGDPRILFHGCDETSHNGIFSFLHTDFLKTWNPKGIVEGLERAKLQVKDMATTNNLLLMDGFDASYPHANSGKIIEWCKKNLKTGDTIVHTSFPKYVEQIKKDVDWSKLQVVKGERRTPATDTMGTSLMQGVLTSHSYFKRANHDSQILAEKYAEPISSFAWMLGADFPRQYLDVAWKYISANHGHDTICGASVDQIYADGLNRLEQAQMICKGVNEKCEFEIMQAVTSKKDAQEGQIVMAFNTTPFTRSDIVTAYLDFQRDEKVKNADFAIEDFSGRALPFSVLGHEELYGVYEDGDAHYAAVFVDRYKVAFLADAVPPMGYKAFRVLSHKQNKIDMPKTMVKGANTMENEHIKVSVNKNGTVDITDKANKKSYKGLGYFEDGGDAGTPWFYIRPEQDQIVTTKDAVAKITLLEDKPLTAAYRVELTMTVPESLTPDKRMRAKKEKKIVLVSTLRLTSESRYLEVHTEIDTPVRDHRLRVKFPTGIDTNFADAEGAFDLMHRDIRWDKEVAKNWIDKEVGIMPQQMFVDLSDGKVGLGILNKGLREYEVEQDKDRTVGITLVRGIRYPKIAGGANPWADDPVPVRCQCMGKFAYDYAIYPHAGDWSTGRLYEESRRFNIPMNLAQGFPGLRVVEPEASFIEISPRSLVLSAFKRAESDKSIILRLFNPTGRKVSGTIRVKNELKRARLVNLNEEPLRDGDLKLRDAHRFDLEFGPKKIVTVELFMKR